MFFALVFGGLGLGTLLPAGRWKRGGDLSGMTLSRIMK